jgi:hypothetical protein
MSLDPAALARHIGRIYPRRAVRACCSGPAAAAAGYAKYRMDPVGFARDVLGVTLTAHQEEIARALVGKNRRVKVNSGHGTGKAQPRSTVIDTPDGRVRFGDLRPGDRVFGRDGRPVRVLGVYPQGTIPAYRVTFDDRSSTVVGAEHLWSVRDRNGRRTGSGFVTLTTEEIARRATRRANGKTTARVWEIPRHGPVSYPERPVPVPGYSMGVWLGDGTVGVGYVTSADPEMPALLAADLGTEVRVRVSAGKAPSLLPVGLKVRLREAGVLDTPTPEKRVPRAYKENSPAVRLAVLQGLMDSDGTADRSGNCSFTSISWGLARDVAWLVRSLGGKARLPRLAKSPFYRDAAGEKVYCSDAYTVVVNLPDHPLFRLGRKASRVRANSRRGGVERYIESVEPCGEADMVCIRVDAPDQLYLCNDFIVTHNTHLAACVATWWHHTRNPSVVITTAPTERDVVDLLWTEIRLLHDRAVRPLPKHFPGPRDPQLFHTNEHWAKGYTARRSESFQGRHRPHMLFIFDESEAVDPPYWTTTNTMFQPDEAADHAWMAIGNPTTTSSASYVEDLAKSKDGSPKWNQFRLSCLDHPNVAAGLAGLPLPVPDAVTVGQIDQYVTDWCTPIDRKEDVTPNDVEWPPASGKWYRPGPNFKARVLGVRPTEGVDTVFSGAAWELMTAGRWTWRECWEKKCGVTIGVDASGYGDDDCCFHVRTGPKALYHESRNGWGPDKAATRVKELCEHWARWYNSLAADDRPAYQPEDVDVVFEFDGGYGVGVHSHGGPRWPRWRGVTVGAASRMTTPDGRLMYANVRAELWCETAKKAAGGFIDVSALDPEVRDRLRVQLLTPYWWSNPNGSRQVEPKKDVKARLQRSPDDADALILSHSTAPSYSPTAVLRG